MMGAHMNGSMNTSDGPQHMTLGVDTPVAYYQPIAITPSVIKWLVGGIIAAIWSLQASGWLFLPAKQTDMETLTRVVQVLQTGQNDAKVAIERLTLAVDNLSGIVVAKTPAPAAPRPRPRPIAKPAELPR
jgi:hypothetical protein